MKRPLLLLLTACLLCGGCALRGYKWATHPGEACDRSAGDITHASEPGARVVIPKHPKAVSK